MRGGSEVKLDTQGRSYSPVRTKLQIFGGDATIFNFLKFLYCNIIPSTLSKGTQTNFLAVCVLELAWLDVGGGGLKACLSKS